jgi:putative flippase GtrA/SAM-dependent methyltransferase
MVEADDHHWWYRGRRMILTAEIDRLGLPEGSRLLDAGCGSGRMLDDLAGYGTVSGTDTSLWAVAAARGRGHRNVELEAVEHLHHPDESFDLVTCLDVLEHVPEDQRALAELWRVTAPGGHLLVTVPAYQTLWSAHDVANHHYRRYRKRGLCSSAQEAGWEVERTTYFNSLLLPAAALVRLARRPDRSHSSRSELSLTPRWLDGLLELPLRVEAMLLRHGGRLPAGLSLLALFHNPDEQVVRAFRARARPAPAKAPVRQFARYCAVGVSNTALSLIAFALAVRAGVPYLAASAAAFALGSLNGYTLNRIWTFSGRSPTRLSLARYTLVQGIGLALNAALLVVLVELVNLESLLAQAVVLPLVSILTFSLNRRWVFAGAGKRGGWRRWPSAEQAM